MADQTRLRELTLLLSAHSVAEGTAEKLPRLLFVCDFTAYARLGCSISGQDYERTDDGPVPSGFEELLSAMVAAGDLEVRSSDDLGGPTVIAHRPARRDMFTAEEIALVEETVARCEGLDSSSVHDAFQFVGWELAEIGETIPYEIALVGSRGPMPDEIEHGRTLTGLVAECLARDGQTQP